MIEGEKLVDKIKALKLKYCNYWEEHQEGDAYYGFHGYMDMLLSEAIKYGFEQGESFGRFAKYAEKVEAKYLIQPENDRVWREKLDKIMEDEGNVPWAQQTVDLLGLIAEILLVRKNGG